MAGSQLNTWDIIVRSIGGGVLAYLALSALAVLLGVYDLFEEFFWVSIIISAVLLFALSYLTLTSDETSDN